MSKHSRYRIVDIPGDHGVLGGDVLGNIVLQRRVPGRWWPFGWPAVWLYEAGEFYYSPEFVDASSMSWWSTRHVAILKMRGRLDELTRPKKFVGPNPKVVIFDTGER